MYYLVCKIVCLWFYSIHVIQPALETYEEIDYFRLFAVSRPTTAEPTTSTHNFQIDRIILQSIKVQNGKTEKRYPFTQSQES